MLQNPESSFKQTAGSTPEVSDSVGLGQGRAFTFPISSQVMLRVHGPHFENHLLTSFSNMFPKCSTDPWEVCTEYQQYPCKNRTKKLTINEFLRAQIKKNTYKILSN